MFYLSSLFYYICSLVPDLVKMLVEKSGFFQYCLCLFTSFHVCSLEDFCPVIQTEKDSRLQCSHVFTCNLDFFAQTHPSVQPCGFWCQPAPPDIPGSFQDLLRFFSQTRSWNDPPSFHPWVVCILPSSLRSSDQSLTHTVLPGLQNTSLSYHYGGLNKRNMNVSKANMQYTV